MNMKTFKNIVFVTLPTILIVMLFLEVCFRTVIPANNPPTWFFDEEEKILCLSNTQKEGVYSIGRFAEIRAKWNINNMHWNYPVDYYPVVEKKLITVIGDSYIEALQVDVDKNYPYLLREKLQTEYEVYAFGKGGAPLSQYLHMSRYINKHFDPDILIINVVHNDFDRSIYDLYQHRAWLQVSVHDDDSITETIPQPPYFDQRTRRLKRVVYKSALFRYLYDNLEIYRLKDKLINKTADAFEANIEVQEVKKHDDLIFKATNYVVKTIAKENRDKRIIFVFDAPRFAIYDNVLQRSEVLWLHVMMETICADHHVEYLDLTSFMEEDFRTKKMKFNSDLDGHWNEYGHKFVAGILYEYLKSQGKKRGSPL